MKKIIFLMVFLLILSACAQADKRIITATGTTIGLDIGQNPTSNLPTTTFGYRRAEYASVPVPDAQNTLTDVPNVLTELFYQRGKDDGNLYQRLAVGEKAVSSLGAALVFAKKEDGTVDPQSVAMIASKYPSPYSASLDEHYARYIGYMHPNGELSANNEDSVVKCFQSHGIRFVPTDSEWSEDNASRLSEGKAQQTFEVFKESFKKEQLRYVLVSDLFIPIRDLCANELGLVPYVEVP